MTLEQVLGIARGFLTTVGGIVIALGYMSDANWASISGGILSIVGIIWSWYSNSTPQLVNAVARAPEVSQVVVSPAMAMAAPSAKVVSKSSRPAAGAFP